MFKKINKKLDNKKAILWSTFFIFIFFILSLIFINEITHSISSVKLKNYTNKINLAIDQDLENLSKQSQEIVDSGILNSYIKNNDKESIIKATDIEKKKRGLDMVMTINDQGVVLSRAEFSERTGDYVLQNKNWGHFISNKHPITVIESGTNYPLLIVAVTPIIEDGQLIGAVNVAKKIDKNFIESIKNRINQNFEFIVFSENEGIIASTINTENNSEDFNFFINSFNTNSGIKTENNPEYISINEQNYHLSFIPFMGISQSPGGVLLVMPHQHFLIVFILSLIFSIIAYLLSYKYVSIENKSFLKKIQSRKQKNVIGLTVLIASLIISSSSFEEIVKKRHSQIHPPSFLIYNSILKISPEQSVIDKNFHHLFDIEIEPGGEKINAVGAIINYDPEKIIISEIIKNNSICRQDMFIEQAIDPDLGQVRIACVLPEYQPSIKNGLIAQLSIKAKNTGNFLLEFDKESSVLAADGLGTNVLRMSVDGTYQVKDFRNEGASDYVLVFSPSHPNSNNWYQNKNVTISISPEKNNQYAYDFNQDPNFEPNNFVDEINPYLNFTSSDDGVYYFHIKSKNGNIESQTNHFKIMIDNEPPRLIEKNVSQDKIKTGEVVRLTFKAEDDRSGIQSTYIKIDNNLLLPVASPVYIPFTSKGNHKITIRSFDNANNYHDEYIDIKVNGDSLLDKIINLDFSKLF